jgi:hypothetical protein
MLLGATQLFRAIAKIRLKMVKVKPTTSILALESKANLFIICMVHVV